MEMKSLQIEKGVPIPGRKGGLYSIASAIRSMDVGDSVVVNKVQRHAALAAAAKAQMKLVTRKQEGGSFRIWRVA